jgi:hypothetical protein
MSTVPDWLPCLVIYCMLARAVGPRFALFLHLRLAGALRGRKLKVPWKLEVGGARALDPDAFRNCDHQTRWTSSSVFVVVDVLKVSVMLIPSGKPTVSLSRQQPSAFP